MYILGLLAEWQYRSLFIEMGRHGYRTREPDGMQAETSQVFTKVFKSLLEDGTSKRQVAAELAILPDEIEQGNFGLALLPVHGDDSTEPL